MPSSHKLESIPMGVLGGPAPASSDATDKHVSRIVSASSSVVSANSLGTSASASVKGLMNASFAHQGAVEEKKEADEDTQAPSGASSSKGAPSSGGNPLMMGLNAPPHPVAEFLFQLTKMLTDDNGRYIEWKSASIFVHDPPGLEKDILPKYFRHSNYSSFQRQMNYFGFRKIAGKGKMAPCSYVNEAAKEDISSLLYIKRKKTGVSSAAAKLMAQQNRVNRAMGGPAVGMGSNLLGLGMGNPPAGLTNLSMMGGLSSMGMGGGSATNLLASNAPAPSSSIYGDQQSVLAQLQQAHASALSASQGVSAAMPQSASKLNLSLMGQSGSNVGGLLTNDQGNLYQQSGNNELSGYQDAAAQSFLNGLASGNFTQGLPQGSTGGSDGFPRIDSAASLRALINQQISMFNAPSADAFPAAIGTLASQSMPPSSMAPEPAPQPAAAGLPQEWNEMLQRMGAGGAAETQASSAGNAHAATIRQLEQQLLQQQQQQQAGGAGAPSPSQFNFNGLFGAGGQPQGY